MRKNTSRHWLHASLDLLPVLLIPVFMIYSHRHSMTEQTQVDIQYKYQSNEVNSYDDLVLGNIYELEINDGSLDEFFNSVDLLELKIIQTEYYDFSNYNISLDDVVSTNFSNVFTNSYVSLYIIDFDGNIQTYINENGYIENSYIGNLTDEVFSFKGIVQVLLLGGITPSTNNPFSYTDYNEIESVDVQDTNSSVMNVFMDNFNTAVDKYFNMGNVFNMNNVYQWFNTNIFGGNAPVVIYSVWNIVLYEFVMDLLFLLYGLFMFFIDMCKRLIEKPINSIK